MTLILKRLARTAVLTGILLLTLAGPAAAKSSGGPCWKLLINDWYDGRIDQTYPLHCYREAIKHLPADVEVYSNARSDIERALLAARLGKPAPPNQGGTNNNEGKGTGESGSPGGEPPPTALTKALDALGPSQADSAPIPLLVLGGLALLLMTAGGAGIIARKVQARREGPQG